MKILTDLTYSMRNKISQFFVIREGLFGLLFLIIFILFSFPYLIIFGIPILSLIALLSIFNYLKNRFKKNCHHKKFGRHINDTLSISNAHLSVLKYHQTIEKIVNSFGPKEILKYGDEGYPTRDGDGRYWFKCKNCSLPISITQLKYGLPSGAQCGRCYTPEQRTEYRLRGLICEDWRDEILLECFKDNL